MILYYIKMTSESICDFIEHKSFYKAHKSISLSCHIALIGNNKEFYRDTHKVKKVRQVYSEQK